MYQGGKSVMVFTSQGNKSSLAAAAMINGKVRREFDKELKGFSYVSLGGNATNFALPKKPSQKRNTFR